jgi:metallo-beta-lactamase family protein
VLLPDSGHLLEEEASFAKKRGSSKHSDPRPVYTASDAVRSLDSFRSHEFDESINFGSDIQVTLVPAGHILGAAQVLVNVDGVSMHFTGDLGRMHDPLMRPPRPLEAVDILVAESTYGNRVHPDLDPASELGPVIRRVAKRGGVVVIPAFAVGRSESLLLHLSRLRTRGEIPDIPVFLNSPMAVNVSEMYQRHPDEHRVSADEFASMYGLAKLVRTVDESKLLNLRGGPMIIISASGMLTGGRVLHHVAAYGSDPKNAIILTGYQAGGTRGAALAQGEDHLRIFGRDIPINAEIVQLETLSAHADLQEILQWMRNTPRAPGMTYLTHGEPDAADALRVRIKRELGRNVRVPDQLDSIDLHNPE